jgi:hypothetical protein
MRISKMTARTEFTAPQRLLLQLQRNQVISSDESDILLTDNAELIQDCYTPDAMKKTFALGKISKIMSTLESH